MSIPNRSRSWFRGVRVSGWWRAGAAVAACTAVSELGWPHGLSLTDIIMVYLAGVSWVAMTERMAVSLGATMASIFLFDLLFVPPRWGLHPIDKSHFVTFAIMLAVGVLITRLAEQARAQRLLAERQARRSEALAGLAGHLAAAAGRDAVGESLRQAVRATFGWEGALVEPGAQGGAAGGLRWPVAGASGRLGDLVVDSGGAALDADDHGLLAAFAHQVAVALERCASEERVVTAQVQAESERLRSTLLSGISHDIRTPLTTIVGAATSLLQQDERLDAGRRAVLVRSMRDEAQRLHALVSDVLDLTRLEDGAVQLALEWCPADDLVQEALVSLGDRLAGHAVEVRAPAECIVWCDPRLVEQALVNMLDNAARHTPPGTRIRVEVAASAGRCLLVVEDDGPGLPPGGEQEVFRKFHRGRPGGAHAGTGLGLAICAAVVRLHGGTIAAANARGARFTIALPQPEPPRLQEAT